MARSVERHPNRPWIPSQIHQYLKMIVILRVPSLNIWIIPQKMPSFLEKGWHWGCTLQLPWLFCHIFWGRSSKANGEVNRCFRKRFSKSKSEAIKSAGFVRSVYHIVDSPSKKHKLYPFHYIQKSFFKTECVMNHIWYVDKPFWMLWTSWIDAHGWHSHVYES